MEKINEVSKKQKEDEKLLEAKVLDKIKQSDSKNRFANTDFLDLAEQEIVRKIVTAMKVDNCQLYGGYENSERKMLVIFPKMLNEYINKENYLHQTMKIIRIILPKELHGTFEHRNYLGALMKLGIKREKVGDILVRNDGADIIISCDIEKFLLLNLNTLTRFQKSKIESKDIQELIYCEKEKETLKINVPSMRLDCIVGELARCSRNDALEIIKQERVFVNFKEEMSHKRNIAEDTYITIRGKGRFKIVKIEGTTRSGRLNVIVEKN